MGLEFGMQPVVSRPVTALNHAITALATHPAQNSVVSALFFRIIYFCIPNSIKIFCYIFI